MKFQTKGNSLRYRLTRSEVTRLGSDGSLEKRTEFAGRNLIYAIEDQSANYPNPGITCK